MDLNRKYRPGTLKELVGQKSVISSIRGALRDGKKSFLLFGESGTGKTTTARIIASTLNCESKEKPCGECQTCVGIRNGAHPSLIEVDAADNRGIDTIREIKREAAFAPLVGEYKIIYFDEAHALTRDSQNALLKIMEDIPEGVCIILCSTEPNKILKTVRNRCQSFQFKPVSEKDLMTLLVRVSKSENLDVGDSILEKITKAVSGLPRNALIRLQQLSQVPKEERTEEVVNEILCVDFDTPAEIINLCRVLLAAEKESGSAWADVSAAYKKVKDYDKELIRVSLAGYFRAVLERTVTIFSKAQLYAAALEILVEPLPYLKPENKLLLLVYKVYILLRTSRNARKGR